MAEAVTKQPESSGESELDNPQVEWMSLPCNVPVCPPGLEYLTHLDQLIVYQQVEIFEALTNIDMKNQYQVRNTMGQQVYAANEESTFCWRFWCGSKRQFAMVITDTNGQEVIRINRPFKCCAGPESCHCAHIDSCSDEMTVEAPPGTIVGKIQHAFSKWYPHIHVKDPDGNILFNIWGPCCQCQTICCRTDIIFKIVSTDEQQEIGEIKKHWGGAVKEWFTKADNFGVTFPKDLDVPMKAAMIGAAFLVNFLYFEAQDEGSDCR